MYLRLKEMFDLLLDVLFCRRTKSCDLLFLTLHCIQYKHDTMEEKTLECIISWVQQEFFTASTNANYSSTMQYLNCNTSQLLKQIWDILTQSGKVSLGLASPLLNSFCHNQHAVQKSASVMLWRCVNGHGMRSLCIYDGTINNGSYIQVLEYLLLSRQCLFRTCEKSLLSSAHSLVKLLHNKE